MNPDGLRARVRAALALLGIERLAFGIHDASFPSDAEDDTGRGTPNSPAGLALLAHAAGLGFDAVQLGPQGATEPGNPSPYDGRLFARDVLSVSLLRLTRDEGLGAWLPGPALEAAVAARPPGGERRVPHAAVHRSHGEALALAHARFRDAWRAGRPEAEPLRAAGAAFRARQRRWLARDLTAEALRRERPGFVPDLGDETDPDQRLYDPRPHERAAAAARRRALRRRHGAALEAFVFQQLLAHEQHRQLRRALAGLGLRLFGDLPVGMSPLDGFAWRGLLLRGYRLGAPPSRTNPEGQPWGHALLDPSRLAGSGLRFVAARLDKAFAEYDGLRIDHPHGWVCPWVYRADATDPARAVQAGARLFASPDLPDHPELARHAIVGRADLNPDPATPRHADDWVVRLDARQEDAYARLFDLIPAAARRHGREPGDLVCEVLSTQPHPLARVLARHGLGRFRVTQKASLTDPADVYRSENARPEDWILFGNHDTPSIWCLIPQWRRDGSLARRAERLAERLVPQPAARPAFAARLRDDEALLAHAHFAELFASPARHVMIYFTDLFGLAEPYNRPGLVAEENWSLRLPGSWRAELAARGAEGRALDLPRALALALTAAGGDSGDRADLARALAGGASPRLR